MPSQSTQALLAILLSVPCCAALSQETAPKSIVAIVGDADKFNIGQEGFCGDRSNIESPSGKQFRIPSDKLSFFYIRSKFHVQVASYICEGDYSFVPAPGMLHVIRYTMNNDHCELEMYQSVPGDHQHR